MINYGLSNIPGLVSAYDLDNPRCCRVENLVTTWTDYNSSQAHYIANGNNVKLLSTSATWVGSFQYTVNSTGNYILEFSYQADSDGSSLVVDNDGVVDNTYNVTLTANIAPKCHYGIVNVTSTGAMQMYFRRNGGGNITVSNVRFYKQQTTWNDLCNPALTGPGNPYWANNIDSITISMVLHKIGTVSGYAEHPVNKWNQSYADNASFILYHFGGDNSVGWYGNVNQDVGSGWTGLTSGAVLSNGTYNHIVLQYSCFNGGQMWANGVKIGGRGSGGLLGQTRINGNTTTYDINIQGPAASSTSRVNHIQFYNRELDDSEIVMLYNSHKKRFIGMP